MTLKSGTGQACAACKYQRRRCTPECLLAPFFPADQRKMFENVHRLFGVKNIQNLLRELSPDQKPMAMKSIKFHAAMRDKYPVYGCLFEIHQITYQIQKAREELQAVLEQLAYHREQHLHQQEISATTEYLSELQLGMAPPGNAKDMQSLVHEELPIGGPQISYSTSCNNDYGINYLDFKENNAVDSFCQEAPYSNNGDSMAMQSQLIAPQTTSVQQESATQDYDEIIHPFFDQIDEAQSYVVTEKANESSCLESPLEDSRSHLVEEMDGNELKSVAACFSLTSVD